MLCSNPRSGSSLLAEALHATGCLGTPIEYFDRTGAMADLLERWDCPDVTAYIDCLHRRRTTVGGLFGAKLHWYQRATSPQTSTVRHCPARTAASGRRWPRCSPVPLRARDPGGPRPASGVVGRRRGDGALG